MSPHDLPAKQNLPAKMQPHLLVRIKQVLDAKNDNTGPVQAYRESLIAHQLTLWDARGHRTTDPRAAARGRCSYCGPIDGLWCPTVLTIAARLGIL